MITQQRQLFRSFAGGEIAPELYGRLDLPKNQTGLKRCYNFMITPQGVAEKRSGFEYIADGFSNGRLEAFVRDDGHGFLLEFRNTSVRIYDNGTLADTVAVPYLDDHAFELSTSQFVNDMTICHSQYGPAVLRRISDTNWVWSGITFNVTLAAPAGLSATANIIGAFPGGDPVITYLYNVTTLDSDGRESAIGSGATANNALRIAGNDNTLSWTSVTNAYRYNVYAARTVNGTLGFIGSSDGNSFVDDNILPDGFTRPPEVLESFTVNYPSQVAFHEQRCLFANTPADPQSFWASGLAGFDYFKASDPPQDDQAFTYQIASKKASPIRHMLALRDVLFFTGSGVFRVFSTTGAAFAPNSVNAIQVNPNGAAPYVRPQEAGNAVLFPIERGHHLFALRYDGSGEGYVSDDLSLIAPHLIDGYTWKQTAMQYAPYQVWWGLRSDGVLIGLTFVAEQQVYAWFQVSGVFGTIKSIAVVPEGNSDSLYALISRVGGTFIERLKPRFGPAQAQEDAFFIDSGVTRSAPTGLVTGLDHLEGAQVVALCDGAPLGPFTVVDGEIDVGGAYSVVQVGLSYAAELELLPLAYEMQALGVGVEKNPSAVHLRVKRSEGIQAGPDYDSLRPFTPQVTDLIGDIPALRDGVHTITVDPSWSLDGSVVLRQDIPLPATISGLALDFAGAE